MGSNTKDGLGFEEVNQTVTKTEIISGNYVYATTSVTTPLVSGATVIADVVSGTTISGTTLFGTNISGGAVHILSEGKLHSVAIGSPYTYGAKIVAGSNVLAAGSNVWVVFPIAFTSVPQSIVASNTKTTAALLVLLGSISTGSFYVEGVTAADTFNWIAVGL